MSMLKNTSKTHSCTMFLKGIYIHTCMYVLFIVSQGSNLIRHCSNKIEDNKYYYCRYGSEICVEWRDIQK
jgi:hypothetical protein